MALILTILFVVCNLGLIIGLFRPEWVLYKLDVRKTTANVLILYGSLSLFTFIAFILFITSDEEDYQLAYDHNNTEVEENLKPLPEKIFEMPATQIKTAESREKKEEPRPQVSEELKKEIIADFKKMDEKAREEARELNPAGPNDLDNGDQLILIRETDIMITRDDDGKAVDPGRDVSLYPGSWIKFPGIENERGDSQYTVEAYAPDGRFYGTGWISDDELKKQWGNIKGEKQLQDELAAELREKGRQRLLNKYDVTPEELEQIISGM